MAPIARCLLATIAILLVPAIAGAAPKVGEHDNGWAIYEESYLRTYERCWEAFKADCGANIVDDGREGGSPPPRSQVEESLVRMENWLNPPEPEPTAVVSPDVVASAPVTTSVPPAPASTGGCTGMEAESGTAGYDAYNPSSGAAGCYQIIPSTAAAHNCNLSTPAGQDECAARICATQGNGAWAASGAAPC